MRGRKVAFWLGVAGVSVVTPFTLQLLSRKIPSLGLQRFIDFTFHSGNGAA